MAVAQDSLSALSLDLLELALELFDGCLVAALARCEEFDLLPHRKLVKLLQLRARVHG